MAMNTEAAKLHAKTYGVNYMIGLLTSTMVMIVGFIALVTAGDPYHATEFEVSEIVSVVMEDHVIIGHLGIAEAVEQISWLYTGNLEERIDQVYMWQCGNSGDRARDFELRDLRSKYFKATEREYHKNIHDFC